MSKTILVVDDDENYLHLLKGRLENAGYKVLCAANGDAAIQLAINESPNLIICDIMMPAKTGAEVSLALKEDPRTRRIPLIFLTALKSKEEERAQGVQSQDGTVIFAKPFESEKLIEKIEELT